MRYTSRRIYIFGHGNVIKYSNRPFMDQFERHEYDKAKASLSPSEYREFERRFKISRESVVRMDETMIERFNSKVGANSTVYILGDVAFYKDVSTTISLLKRMNGRKILIAGNHDKYMVKDRDFRDCFEHVRDFMEIKHENQSITLCHYAMLTWNKSHYKSWMLHGHCVDLDTEILTTAGWKYRKDLMESDYIYNVNPITGLIEENSIKIVDNIFTGNVINFNGKSISFRVTDNHRIVGYNRGNKWKETLAKELHASKGMKFIRGSTYNHEGLNLSDDMLRLYVYCTADGCLKPETNLWRIRVKKEHKKVEIKRCLNKLNIQYSEIINGDYVTYSFYTPNELINYTYKGLDCRIQNMTDKQFKVFLDAYSLSDGNKNGDGVMIYTSKKKEVDIISMLAITHGHGCTINERVGHGFSDNVSYQLSIYPNQQQVIRDFTRITNEEVVEEHFWCVTTKNGNFFMRRNGKIHLTGNSHGSLPDDNTQLRIDVGVDCHDFYPISFSEVKDIMSKKKYSPIDHHGE